jgi:hypothetical protein
LHVSDFEAHPLASVYLAAAREAGVPLRDDFIREAQAGAAIEAAIARTAPKMKSQVADQMGFTTTQVGDLVAAAL